MTVPYSFGTATSAIPLSQLDSNFNTPITLGNTAIQLGNTVTTLNNMTLANVTISSGNVTLTNVSVTTANVATANIATSIITSSETLSYGTANGVAYLNGSKVVTTGSALVFDGTNLGIGTSSPGYKLDVVGSAARLSYNTAGGGALLLNNTSGTSFKSQVTWTASGTAKFSIGLDASGAGANNFFWYDEVAGATRMTLDSSGNLGLGVTPSAWVSGRNCVEIGGSVQPSIAFNGSTVANGGGIWTNGFNNGTNNVYKANGTASRLDTGAGGFAFYLAPSGTAGAAISFTQAMTLDASGNLGIGTSSPTTAFNKSLQVYQPGTGNAGLRVNAGSATGFDFIQDQTGASFIYNRDNSYIAFGTNNTECARITSGGYFCSTATGTLFGTTSYNFSWSDAQRLYLYHASATAANAYGIEVRYNSTPNGTGNEFLYCTDTNGGTLRASVRSNGGLANYSANDVNLSDRREKTNFAPAKSYLDTICAIPVQTFNYIDQNLEEDPGTTLGVVAQDVQAVAPELVMESNWGTEDDPKMRLSIYQTDLQYALMKCIQEQQALITQLTERITALEAK